MLSCLLSHPHFRLLSHRRPRNSASSALSSRGSRPRCTFTQVLAPERARALGPIHHTRFFPSFPRAHTRFSRTPACRMRPSRVRQEVTCAAPRTRCVHPVCMHIYPIYLPPPFFSHRIYFASPKRKTIYKLLLRTFRCSTLAFAFTATVVVQYTRCADSISARAGARAFVRSRIRTRALSCKSPKRSRRLPM